MIDKVRFRITPKNLPNPFLQDHKRDFEWKGVVFNKKYNQTTGTIYYYGNDNNIRIKWVYPNVLIFGNSLHKYCHNSNNNDFNFNQVCNTILTIANKFEFDPSKSTLTRIEYGYNLFLENDQGIYNDFIGYKKCDSVSMVKSNGNLYGKKCDFQEYAIKLYDKDFESLGTRNKKDINLRIEIAVKNMKYLRNRKSSILLKSLSDLMIIDNWNKLHNDILEKINNSRSASHINIDLLKREYLNAFAFFSTTAMVKKALRKKYPKAYLEELKIYKSLINNYPGRFQKLTEGIKLKHQELLLTSSK